MMQNFESFREAVTPPVNSDAHTSATGASWGEKLPVFGRRH